MSLIPAKCIEYDEIRTRCIASESGKMYKLENESRFKIKKVKVDGCFAQNAGEQRCDYLFVIDNEETKRAIFVELKGGDLVKALQQVFSTVTFIKKELTNYRLDARIVGTRDVPGFVDTIDYRKLAREIKLSNGTIQRATNKILSEKI